VQPVAKPIDESSGKGHVPSGEIMTLPTQSERVRIQAGDVEMEGMLWLPEDHIGIVLFAHGGGSNRVTPPNDYVASVLRDARLGTFWLDLLAPEEARSHRARCDIALLTERLSAACDWLRHYGATSEHPIGLFGAGNAAAAAFQLAAVRGRAIAAIVSRGGRPDLACQTTLGKISVPTLLIVGGLDDGVVEINRAAYAALRCKKRFEIIPGATHAFEEPGNLEVVARLARGWFLQHSYSAHV
jgi:putative phosphoribosyl transferase